MGEWISVKDRLPEPFVYVLTIDSMGLYFVDYVNAQGEWLEGDSEENPVTHWTKLPEPPKEGQ